MSKKRNRQLFIDPSGGMAGDIFAAALISAGADGNQMKKAMLVAAQMLGEAEIDFKYTLDQAVQFDIKLSVNHHHLHGHDARKILQQLFVQFKMDSVYQRFGIRILEILLAAEMEAHTKLAHLFSSFPSHHPQDAMLHEAQDIVIDIIGAVTGLQELNIEPKAVLLAPVNVGGGTISFSHGTLPVPAPATQIILEKHHIPWKTGPVDSELCTPTGASIMAALSANRIKALSSAIQGDARPGSGRGSKILPIPPVKIFAV